MLEKNMDSMSAKQIRGALGLKNSVTAKLKAELQKLIKNGKIDKKGSLYFLTMKKALFLLHTIDLMKQRTQIK